MAQVLSDDEAINLAREHFILFNEDIYTDLALEKAKEKILAFARAIENEVQSKLTSA